MGNKPSTVAPEPPVKDAVSIDEERIRSIVDKFLENQKINVGFIPDVVERNLYVNLLRILLHLLNEVSKETSLTFLGHEIQISVKPSRH